MPAVVPVKGRCSLPTRLAQVLRRFTVSAAAAKGAAEALGEPYVIEYYYKAKWGHAEEFLGLFKKNHLPVL